MMKLASRSFPYGLGSLSGTLKAAGYEFSVLDADALDMPLDKMMSAVIAENPRIIGISTYTSYADITKYVVDEIKKKLKDCLVVLGGHHAFTARDRLLDETQADIVAIGEGEVLFAEVCDAILNGKGLENVKGIYFKKSGKIVYTSDRDYIKELDTLPMPAYEYFPMDKYQSHFWRGWISGYRKPSGSIITSRGCPFSCGFCSNVMWGKRVRYRSPESVISEVDYLVKHYGVRQMTFFDDTFTVNMKRAERICDLLIERDYGLDLSCATRVDFLNEPLIRKMAKAGFKWIGIGIESGNDRILKRISKGVSVKDYNKILHIIADNGIAIIGGMILGYPGEDKGSLMDTLNFTLKNPIHFSQFSIFVAYPGTPVYDALVTEGHIIPSNTNQFSRVVSYNRDISRQYLIFFQWYIYIRIFMNPRYLNMIRKTFKMRIVFSDILKMVWAMIKLDRAKSKATELQ
jgi:anaerobic magnesium-protoporphyrin IX monomethyl ester cyclase